MQQRSSKYATCLAGKVSMTALVAALFPFSAHAQTQAITAEAPASSADAPQSAAPTEQPKAPISGPRSDDTGGDIVVTAQRREQKLRDVPIAITAFSAKDRALKGILTVQDMTNFTPGFSYSSGLDRPVVRGLARNNNVFLSDSAVAVYYDDVFSSSTALVGRDDMLIDHVEILLGPQGTLYGRNAVGGLINTISKRPTDVLSGEARFIVGNYGYTKIEGTIAGPIKAVDGLSFRLALVDLNQTRGYFKNLAGPSEGDVRHNPYGEIQLQYKDDRNEIWLHSYANAFRNDRGGPGGSMGIPTGGPYDTALATSGQLVFNPNFPFGGGAIPGSVVGMVPGLTNNPALQDIRTFAHSVSTNINQNDAFGVSLHLIHHFDGFDVKYIGGYNQYHYKLSTAYFSNGNSSITAYQIPLAPGGVCASMGAACSPLTVHPAQVFGFEAWSSWSSHELNFSSTGKGAFQWIAGLYRFDEDDNNPETFQEPDQAQLANPVGGPPNPSRNYLYLDYQDHISSTAAYGQVDWKVSPKIKLTAGLRYTYDEKHGQEQARYVLFQNVSPTISAQNLGSMLPAIDITASQISYAPERGVSCAPTLQTTGRYAGTYMRCLKDHSDAITGTAGIAWTPDDDTLVYARYNRGYKAFGFNAGYLSAHVEARPEYVNDYELGLKKAIGRFTLDANAFHYDYRDAQIPIGVPVGAVIATQFINIPKSISQGIELSASWRPINRLNLGFVYGFNRTRIQSQCALVGGVATGACYVDAFDNTAVAQGARPVGSTGAQAVDGAPLPQAPRNKIAFNTTYTFPFAKGDLTASGSYIWRDRAYYSIFPRDYAMAPSWDQVDLRLTWSDASNRYTVVGYARNLFDTLGYSAAAQPFVISAPVGGGGPTQASSYDLTPPRTYGVEFHYKF
jgi:iron complex outermembrane receptor protein